MKNKIFFLGLAALFFQLAKPVLSEAHDIFVIKSAEIMPYEEALEGFKSSSGCRVTDEVVMTGTDSSDILRQVRESNSSAVFAIGMDAMNLSKSIKDIPVVYAMVPHAPALSSDSKPLSGVSMFIPADRYIASMIELFQGIKRIGVIYDPRNSGAYIETAVEAAQVRGVELIARKAARPADIPALIDAMKDRIDVFWMLPDPTVINSETIKYLLLFSFRNKVPVFTFSRKYVETGAAAGLYTNPFDIGVQAGEIARKIVSDKTPKMLKSDAKKTVLVVNKKIIKKLGIRVREDALRRAEYID